jgi:hypothetical protein
VCGGNAQHQARRGNDAVIRAQYGGAKPADAVGAVPLEVT